MYYTSLARQHSTFRSVTTVLSLVSCLVLASCGTGAASDSERDSAYPESITVADGDSGSDFHPASGYGQTGVSLVYDGLYRPAAPEGTKEADGQLPTLVPALAKGEPKESNHGTTWTIRLREGITFSDGSTFGAEDVVATYDTVRSAQWGSEIAERYSLITSLDAPDPHTVVVHLREPYPAILSRLTVPIAPSELVGQGSAEKNPLTTHPVGTGPYRLVDHTADRAVYEANDKYWNGAPEVKVFTVVTIPDETIRAQRVGSGELDGALVPPTLADQFTDRSDLSLDAVRTADWRGISLPALPELRDPRVRRALNYGVDRSRIIDSVVHGHGTPISTYLWDIYGDSYDPDAVFTYDLDRAQSLLDEAGWHQGAEGIREKDGKRLTLPVMYKVDDTLRRDLAVEFQSQMKELGVEVTLEAATWDVMTLQLDTKGCVLGGGDSPYDEDLQEGTELSLRTPDSTPYANPGNYGSPARDALVAAARSETDLHRRSMLYRQLQQDYLSNPTAVLLVSPHHLYVSHDTQWAKSPEILEPHIHSATWGPWWDLARWSAPNQKDQKDQK